MVLLNRQQTILQYRNLVLRNNSMLVKISLFWSWINMHDGTNCEVSTNVMIDVDSHLSIHLLEFLNQIWQTFLDKNKNFLSLEIHQEALKWSQKSPRRWTAGQKYNMLSQILLDFWMITIFLTLFRIQIGSFPLFQCYIRVYSLILWFQWKKTDRKLTQMVSML